MGEGEAVRRKECLLRLGSKGVRLKVGILDLHFCGCNGECRKMVLFRYRRK